MAHETTNDRTTNDSQYRTNPFHARNMQSSNPIRFPSVLVNSARSGAMNLAQPVEYCKTVHFAQSVIIAKWIPLLAGIDGSRDSSNEPLRAGRIGVRGKNTANGSV
jgi:hypothetical protein